MGDSEDSAPPDYENYDAKTKPSGDAENVYDVEMQPRENREVRSESIKKQNWRNAVIVDKSLWWKLKMGCFEMRFNPIVSMCSLVIILAFVLTCILATDDASEGFKVAKTWVTEKFTWLYIGSQDIWALAIIIIWFSKYGDIKLGKDDEEPEYNDGTWFAMLFACGVGVGLFFYGVAEPVWHYTGGNRYYADKYMPDNELAQNAINLTFFHWGIHGWIVYVIIGLMLAFMTFRKGMPMTMKTCFYPLIGDRIYGWIGDAVDILSIITTLFGVCTSLGLGTMQINAGLHYINSNIAVSTENQVIIIWCITAVATLSVISGVGMGIRRLSELCFGLGMFIMLSVFFLEDSWFLLNLYTQSIGYYLQWIIQLGFHCDAFEMSTPSYGGAERERGYPDLASDGSATWMNSWTIFYWGWWISWSPFVGMFIAKISRGRTIRQFINGTLTAPMVYTFIWLTIFGGAGIKEERQAAAQNLCCTNFDVSAMTNNTVMDPYLSSMNLTNSWNVSCVGGNCNPCSMKIMHDFKYDNVTMGFNNLSAFRTNMSDGKYRWGKYNHNESAVRLSCLGTTDMWFALMFTYGDLGYFLSVISLIGIILYFVTSSDSGSLVIDIMAANGDQEPPAIQRIFWALVEGATATALLVAGGSEALGALQTASIVTGLPYTIILCFITISLWRALAMECGDLNPYGDDFRVGLVDPFCTIDLKVQLGFLKNIFITPYTLYRTLAIHGQGNGTSITIGAISFLCWVAWIILMICEVAVQGMYAIAWVFFIAFVTCVTYVRHEVRAQRGINGNPIEDFFAALFLYPSVAIQMEMVSDKKGMCPLMPDKPKDKKKSKKSTVHTNEAAA